MEDKDVSAIRDLAALFRRTIEQMNIEEFPESRFFENFPKGCCGDASNLLSKYLSENGFITEYVWGMRGAQSHAWLEYKDLIIDITANQFHDIIHKVFLTKDRSWHSQFSGQTRQEGDFDKFDGYNRKRLRTIYKNIIKRISGNIQE